MGTTANQAFIPSTGKVTSDSSALPDGMAQPLVLGVKQTWSERLKGLLAKLDKALEGDHEFHKYLGM